MLLLNCFNYVKSMVNPHFLPVSHIKDSIVKGLRSSPYTTVLFFLLERHSRATSSSARRPLQRLERLKNLATNQLGSLTPSTAQ